MKITSFIVLSLLPFLLLSQPEEGIFYFNRHFTDLVHQNGISVHTDSLQQFVLTDDNTEFGQNWDLSLVNPYNQSRVFIRFKKNPPFPHITFSSSIVNLQNNQVDHALAFYSLDPYFIVSELNADWAVDCSFIPKGKESAMGYGRSFYQEEGDVQVIVVVIAEDLPILKAPTPVNALRFKGS